MKRLTERELDAYGDACYYKCHSNDCDYECDECNILSEGANKLKAYEDAEEQLLKAAGVDLPSMIGEFMHYYNLQKEGRLVELPCNVGDTIYVITSPYNIVDCEENYRQPPQIFECIIESISLYKCGTRQYRAFFNNEFVAHYLTDDNFGKTVFLTREEAEAALERIG